MTWFQRPKAKWEQTVSNRAHHSAGAATFGAQQSSGGPRSGGSGEASSSTDAFASSEVGGSPARRRVAPAIQTTLSELVQSTAENVVDAIEVTWATRELTLEEEETLFNQEMKEANDLREDAKYSKSTWLREANENEMGVDFTPEALEVTADLNQRLEEKERQALERWNRYKPKPRRRPKLNQRPVLRWRQTRELGRQLTCQREPELW